MPRPEKTLFILLGVIAALTFITPFLNEPGTLVGLDGTTGTIDNPEKWDGMDPVSYAFYYAGDLLCHQKEARSLILNGNQMPICARDAGLFLGVPLGFLAMWRWPRSVPWAVIIMLGLPTVLDGSIQLFTEYESNNITRFVTGVVAGAGIAFAMMRVYYEFTEPVRKE